MNTNANLKLLAYELIKEENQDTDLMEMVFRLFPDNWYRHIDGDVFNKYTHFIQIQDIHSFFGIPYEDREKYIPSSSYRNGKIKLTKSNKEVGDNILRN